MFDSICRDYGQDPAARLKSLSASVVVHAADFGGGCLHDRVIKRDLTIAGHRRRAVMNNSDYSRCVHIHGYLYSTFPIAGEFVDRLS